MARALRLEFAGALYHLTSRGDRQESIFLDDGRFGAEKRCWLSDGHTWEIAYNPFWTIREDGRVSMIKD